MKTKNNVQKTASRTAAVIVSLVLISFTVTAQDFWKKVLANSSFNQIALAVVDTRKDVDLKENGTKDSSNPKVFPDSEQNLTVEDWMTDLNYFNAKPMVVEAETEAKLQIEPWMLNENVFSAQVETESPLTIEKWMTNEEIWK